MRRAYVDGRHGQLHLTTAYPSGGGFDERTPLICLHPADATGSWFKSLLPEFGSDRSVYAPDLPAHGQSDPAGAILGVGDYINAMGDLLESLRLRAADVLGHGLGAMVAAELATQRPEQIRRVVVVAADEAGQTVQASQRTARIDSARVAALNQPVLLLYPTAAGAVQRRPDATRPQHTATALPHTVEDLFSGQVKELARVLHGFLDG